MALPIPFRLRTNQEEYGRSSPCSSPHHACNSHTFTRQPQQYTAVTKEKNTSSATESQNDWKADGTLADRKPNLFEKKDTALCESSEKKGMEIGALPKWEIPEAAYTLSNAIRPSSPLSHQEERRKRAGADGAYEMYEDGSAKVPPSPSRWKHHKEERKDDNVAWVDHPPSLVCPTRPLPPPGMPLVAARRATRMPSSWLYAEVRRYLRHWMAWESMVRPAPSREDASALACGERTPDAPTSVARQVLSQWRAQAQEWMGVPCDPTVRGTTGVETSAAAFGFPFFHICLTVSVMDVLAFSPWLGAAVLAVEVGSVSGPHHLLPPCHSSMTICDSADLVHPFRVEMALVWSKVIGEWITEVALAYVRRVQSGSASEGEGDHRVDCGFPSSSHTGTQGEKWEGSLVPQREAPPPPSLPFPRHAVPHWTDAFFQWLPDLRALQKWAMRVGPIHGEEAWPREAMHRGRQATASSPPFYGHPDACRFHEEGSPETVEEWGACHLQWMAFPSPLLCGPGGGKGVVSDPIHRGALRPPPQWYPLDFFHSPYHFTGPLLSCRGRPRWVGVVQHIFFASRQSLTPLHWAVVRLLSPTPFPGRFREGPGRRASRVRCFLPREEALSSMRLPELLLVRLDLWSGKRLPADFPSVAPSRSTPDRRRTGYSSLPSASAACRSTGLDRSRQDRITGFLQVGQVLELQGTWCILSPPLPVSFGFSPSPRNAFHSATPCASSSSSGFPFPHPALPWSTPHRFASSTATATATAPSALGMPLTLDPLTLRGGGEGCFFNVVACHVAGTTGRRRTPAWYPPLPHADHHPRGSGAPEQPCLSWCAPSRAAPLPSRSSRSPDRWGGDAWRGERVPPPPIASGTSPSPLRIDPGEREGGSWGVAHDMDDGVSLEDKEGRHREEVQMTRFTVACWNAFRLLSSAMCSPMTTEEARTTRPEEEEEEDGSREAYQQEGGAGLATPSRLTSSVPPRGRGCPTSPFPPPAFRCRDLSLGYFLSIDATLCLWLAVLHPCARGFSPASWYAAEPIPSVWDEANASGVPVGNGIDPAGPPPPMADGEEGRVAPAGGRPSPLRREDMTVRSPPSPPLSSSLLLSVLLMDEVPQGESWVRAMVQQFTVAMDVELCTVLTPAQLQRWQVKDYIPSYVARGTPTPLVSGGRTALSTALPFSFTAACEGRRADDHGGGGGGPSCASWTRGEAEGKRVPWDVRASEKVLQDVVKVSYMEKISAGVLSEASPYALVFSEVELVPRKVLLLLHSICTSRAAASPIPFFFSSFSGSMVDGSSSMAPGGPRVEEGYHASSPPRIGEEAMLPTSSSHAVRRDGGQCSAYHTPKSFLFALRDGLQLARQPFLFGLACRVDVAVRPAVSEDWRCRYEYLFAHADLDDATAASSGASCEGHRSGGPYRPRLAAHYAVWQQIYREAILILSFDEEEDTWHAGEGRGGERCMPGISDACGDLLQQYFLAAKAVFGDAIDTNMMEKLVKLARIHALLRSALWEAASTVRGGGARWVKTEGSQNGSGGPPTAAEVGASSKAPPVASSFSSTYLIDALVAIGLCDNTLHFLTGKTVMGRCVLSLMEAHYGDGAEVSSTRFGAQNDFTVSEEKTSSGLSPSEELWKRLEMRSRPPMDSFVSSPSGRMTEAELSAKKWNPADHVSRHPPTSEASEMHADGYVIWLVKELLCHFSSLINGVKEEMAVPQDRFGE